MKNIITTYRKWRAQVAQQKLLDKQAELEREIYNKEAARIQQAESFISYHQDDDNSWIKTELVKILDVPRETVSGMYFDLVLGIYIETHIQTLISYRLNKKQ